MREMNFLSDRLLIAILFKRPLAQLVTPRSSWDKSIQTDIRSLVAVLQNN
jgi:hypothetical protein